MANTGWYLPDALINPLGTLWDVANAYPLGILSMAGVAPQGSKEAQVKAISAFVPAKITIPATKTTPETTQTFKQWSTNWVEQSKKTSTTAKTFWTQDTIPEMFPGQDWLGDWGKYIPLIIIGVAALWLIPKLFKGDKE